MNGEIGGESLFQKDDKEFQRPVNPVNCCVTLNRRKAVHSFDESDRKDFLFPPTTMEIRNKLNLKKKLKTYSL